MMSETLANSWDGSETRTPFFSELARAIEDLGGLFNAHLHLDRAGTYHETMELLAKSKIRDAAALPISGKHALIPMIHDSSMYDVDALSARVARFLERMVAFKTTRADTVVDTTKDRVGRSAIDAFFRLKDSFSGRLDLRVGAYSPLGFRDDEPERWTLLEDAARDADFLGLLPERDDREMYPDHIGFRECCLRSISLAKSLNKKIHVHVDQANHAFEHASETILEVLDQVAAPPPIGEPDIWLIHVISPSAYSEDRFDRLAQGLVDHNVGIITCPSAALSMRQYRGLQSPTHNSIARVLEFLAKGVQVRVGSDNVCDITSPMGTTDLLDEMFVLSNALRFYDVPVLARLAAGKPLRPEDIQRVAVHLEEDRDMAQRVERELSQA